MTTVTIYAIKAEFDDVVRYVGRTCKPSPQWRGDPAKCSTIIEPVLRTSFMPAYGEPGAIKYTNVEQAYRELPYIHETIGDPWHYAIVPILMEWGKPETAKLAGPRAKRDFSLPHERVNKSP